MIISTDGLDYVPFADPRGLTGTSGQLHLVDVPELGTLLVKSARPADVPKEYVGHKVALAIGVPTSDAFLIRHDGKMEVGMTYERDFTEIELPSFTSAAGRFPDDSPLFPDLLAYIPFHCMIRVSDYPQLAISGGRLVSFDYGRSFALSDARYDKIISEGDYSLPLEKFKTKMPAEWVGYGPFTRRLLGRKETDELRKAFYAPVREMRQADFAPVLAELSECFPPAVHDYFKSVLDFIKEFAGDVLAGKVVENAENFKL